MIRFLSLTLTVALWSSWGLATPYNQHLSPCDPIPDLPVSDCQSACIGCNTTVKRLNKQQNSPINVALNRPAVMPHAWQCSADSEDRCNCKQNNSTRNTFNEACGAVNGLRNLYISTQCITEFPFDCSHTGCQGGDWWYVDLEKPVSVKLIKTLLRVLKGANGTEYLSYTRMSDIMIFIDAQSCLKSTTGTNSELYDYFKENNFSVFDKEIDIIKKVEVNYWCSTPLRGRYVRYQKIPNAYHKCIHFCEVEVYACSSNMKAMGGWNDNYNPDFLSCEGCGSSSACSTYPCDNYHGCFGPAEATNRATNVAMMKQVTGKSHASDYPFSNVVDGVYTPRDFRCYKSNEDSEHYVRVDLELLYQIIKADVITLTGSGNELVGFEVRTARVMTNIENANHDRVLAGDTLCWRKEGTLGEVYSTICNDCAENLDNCPRARYVTFFPSSPATYLRLCEVMVYGFPFKELPLGSVCGVCKLEACAGRLQCQNGKCKSDVGDKCFSDGDCLYGSDGERSCQRQICKLTLNGDCSGRKEALCGSGLTCVHTVCKLSLGMGNCTTNDDCAQLNYTCDYARKCRVGLGYSCKKHSDCVAGARCEQPGCACNKEYSNSSMSANQKICKPKVYGKNCTLDRDCGNASSNAVCNKRCQCKPCFNLNDRDFTCKVDLGCPCHPTDIGNPCIDGMTCQKAGNSTVCLAGFGSPCNPGRDRQCTAGKVCDEISKQCLYEIGQSCNASSQCPAEGICQCPAEGICQSRHCVISSGGKCNSSRANQCEHGYTCGVSAASTDSQTTCISAVGNVCNDGSLCPAGTFCNYFSFGDKYCRIDIGKSCKPANDMCRENAKCSTQGQCVWKVGSPCLSSEDCGSDALCDNDNKCRYKIGQDCSETPTFCQIRSRCNNQTNRCTCLDIVNSDANCTIPPSLPGKQVPSLLSSSCKPLGVNDTIQEQCSAAGKAKCDKTKGQCVCVDGYGPGENLVCRPNVGFRCASINENSTEEERTHRCVAGAVCENNQCLLEVDQPCIDKERLYCVTGSTCDRDGKCKLLIGSSCGSKLSGMCLQGTVCDQFHKCKYPRNSTKCQYDSSCVIGAKCLKDGCGNFTCCQCDKELSKPSSVGKTCDLNPGKVGGECLSGEKCEDSNAECLSTSGHCVCKNGFEVSEIDLVCKVAEGFPCKATGECVPGKVCDENFHVCKLPLGSRCTASATADTGCADGAICAEGICKIEEGGLCDSETKRPHCRVDTVCDILGKCKKGVGRACNATDECGAGMYCRENLCHCYIFATFPQSGWCSPKKGRIGAHCSESSNCKVAKSFCDVNTGTCGCDTDVIPRDLTCNVGEDGKSQSQLIPMGVKILFSFLAMLACVLLILALVYKKRGSEKKGLLEEEMAERMATLQQLTAQLHDLESLQQTDKPDLSKDEHAQEVEAEKYEEEDEEEDEEEELEEEEGTDEEGDI